VSNRHPRRVSSLFGQRKTKRRPEGVSRKRKKQFSFEPLEDRRYMTAVPLVTPPAVASAGTTLTGSFSSDTPEGQYLTLQNELYWQSLIAAAQNQAAPTSTAGSATMSLPNDPLLPLQWHLINTGQQVGNPDYQAIYGKPGEDIHVLPVWNQGITGQGVKVGVFDTGVQLDHPDLAANIDLNLAFDAENNQGTGNPVFGNFDSFHGTAVAGIIGAVANNGIGGVGVAPGVTLVPVRLIDQDPTPSSFTIDNAFLNRPFVQAFRYAIDNGIDITSNSWGTNNPLRRLDSFAPDVLDAIRDSVIFGRNGLGVINVFASGNSAGNTFNDGFSDVGTFDSANYGVTNTRYVITVGAVDHDGSYNNVDGTVTNYPEAGANVLVVAPTGSFARINIADDTGIGSGIVTTDLTGDFGANAGIDPDTGFPADRDFLADTDYTSRMNGTSAAAPVVSGVIALMLQANPNLSWRDVQEILVRSARQNDPFSAPGTGAGLETQSTWIINQVPLFHDPDRYVAGLAIDPDMQTLRPVADPNQLQFFENTQLVLANNIASDHYVVDPLRLTTGAGYTVSQGIGRYGEQIGYGHGAVDADLAVKLAQQWTTKRQSLPSELTFTSFVAKPNNPWTLPAAVRSNDASGNQIIPGGIGGQGNFVEWWEEYYDANPDFSSFQSYRGDEFIEFTVPDSQAMDIESVDVRLNIPGDAQQALEHVRITLISPDGTQSELNHYIVDGNPITTVPNQTFQWVDLTKAHPILGSFGTTDPATAPLVYTFNTNRSWGERANDRIVFDPQTGEPVIDQTGFLNGTSDILGNITPSIPGQVLKQGWRLAIENWDRDTSFSVSDIEIAWHGRPIAQNSQRILGFVGVDDNRDDKFNYSRVIQTANDLDGDPSTLRLGEIVNTIDLTQESFAANQTVTVRRTSDNAIVDQFVTGADGNFYFDLVPGDYMISVEDPEGRTAIEDTVTQSGLLQHYKSQWHITPEWFKAWDHANGNAAEVVADSNGNPVPWLDGNGQQVTYGMTGINFLLDPGEIPPQQAVFTGTVYADANGDGAFNGTDVLLPGASVYGDINRNGHYDAGEVIVTTDANGQYNLTVPVTQQLVMGVGVIPPTQWTVTNPAGGVYSQFVTPGTQVGNLNFFLKPAANNAGGGGAAEPGTLMGSVFIDVNGNTVRDPLEQSAAGVTVYIDDNNNGVAEVTERKAVANEFGGYVFTNVEPGQHVIRLATEGTFTQTLPAGGAARVVNLTGSSVISGITFGIRDAAIYDFGDLPAKYNATLLADNGARHLRGPYWLGSGVDGELDGTPSSAADSDDNNNNLDDENGVAPIVFTAGAGATLSVTASRYNGYLQGWIDWNDDGDFNDSGERVITNRLLDGGANSVDITVPAGVTATQVYARFRYGEFGINSVVGAALTGEVEDYVFTVIPAASPLVGVAADFNQDGRVDGFDFLAWQRNAGRTSGATQAQGNADGDSDVDKFDLAVWKQDFGSTASAAALMASEESAGAADEFADVLSGGGSAPLALTSGALAASETTRPMYRPTLTISTADVPSVDSELASAGDLKVAKQDAAIDSMFGADEVSDFDGESTDLDGDEAFALLGSGLV
jgi:subtilisin family serine protease